MSKALEGLEPEFLAKVEAALALAQSEGLTMYPYFGLRDPITQAKLWRQSRARSVVEAKIASLKAEGALFLAWCLTEAGPCDGPPVTNAGPGESWHQYGEAVDCYVVNHGEPDWNDNASYRKWAAIGEGQGLYSGINFGDNDHLQFRATEPPTVFGGPKGMDEALQKLWAEALGYDAPEPVSSANPPAETPT